MDVLYGIGVLLVALLLIKLFWRRNSVGNLPPGPPGKLFVGNMFDISPDRPYISLTDISREFGDIFTLQIRKKIIVVVNTIEAFRDLYEENKHGEKLDGRERTFAGEIIGDNVSISLSQNTTGRKLRRDALGAAVRNLTHFHGRKLQEEISHLVEFIGNKGDEPQDLTKPIQLYITNICLTVLTGERYEYDDPRLIMSHDRGVIVRNFVRPQVNSLMTKFPWLRHLPFGPGKSFGRCTTLAKKLKDTIFDPIKDSFHPNELRGGIDRLLKLQSETHGNLASELTDDKINMLALSFIGSGTVVPIGVLLYFIVVILNQPEIAKKLRKEMDSVLVRSRIPTLADRSRMTYAQAVVLELFRWVSPAPLLVPRRADEDVQFRGYTIPKDATVITNAWKILHDPTLWKNPWEFRPERFIGPNGYILHDLQNNVISFGGGKRKCLGTDLAYHFIFLYVTTMVQKLKFEAPSSDIPNMDPHLSSTLNAALQPEPFKVIVKPRSH